MVRYIDWQLATGAPYEMHLPTYRKHLALIREGGGQRAATAALLESLGDNIKRGVKHVMGADYARLGSTFCLSERQVEDLCDRCANCHAANAEGVAGSSDDRTPLGEQEGMSCTDCHKGHDMKADPSRGRCPHPQSASRRTRKEGRSMTSAAFVPIRR